MTDIPSHLLNFGEDRYAKEREEEIKNHRRRKD